MVTSGMGIFAMLSFFVTMLFCIALGQRIAKNKPVTSGLSVTEGAVFTLMGLLVTFTFAGASQRYDLRRSMITEETKFDDQLIQLRDSMQQ